MSVNRESERRSNCCRAADGDGQVRRRSSRTSEMAGDQKKIATGKGRSQLPKTGAQGTTNLPKLEARLRESTIVEVKMRSAE